MPTEDLSSEASNLFAGILRDQADELVHRAETLEKQSSQRFDSAPGAFVTGGSGRRRSGLQRKTAQAIDGSLNDLAKAKALRQRAAALRRRADMNDPEKLRELAAKRERAEAANKELDRRESEKRKAAPILNRRGGLEMTSAEWSKTHRDFKSLMMSKTPDGKDVRLRMRVRGGALHEVFLTDKKEVVA